MKSFSNKVAVITGAGSGMGRALAIELAKQNCAVAISDVSEQALQETAAMLEQYQVKVSCEILDVSDRSAMERYAKDMFEAHGQINLVFNNAGVSVTDSAEHMSYQDFEWLMNINFWGVVYGTKSFLPYLQKADEGHIINTSSIFGILSFPSQSAYNASKFAVRGYTESLRQELNDSHINVSCVHPGKVETNIINKSRYTVADNEAPTKQEMTEMFDSMPGLTSVEAALVILNGVKGNKYRIMVGRDARFLALIARIAPVNYPRLLQLISSPFGAAKKKAEA